MSDKDTCSGDLWNHREHCRNHAPSEPTLAFSPRRFMYKWLRAYLNSSAQGWSWWSRGPAGLRPTVGARNPSLVQSPASCPGLVSTMASPPARTYNLPFAAFWTPGSGVGQSVHLPRPLFLYFIKILFCGNSVRLTANSSRRHDALYAPCPPSSVIVSIPTRAGSSLQPTNYIDASLSLRARSCFRVGSAFGQMYDRHPPS